MLCYVVLTETIGKLNIYIESIHNGMTSFKLYLFSLYGPYGLYKGALYLTFYLYEYGRWYFS